MGGEVGKWNVGEIEKMAGEKFHKFLTKASLVVQRRAKKNAPWLTTNLRRSIAREVGPLEAKIGIIGEVPKAVPDAKAPAHTYAYFQEIGTKNMKAHPYLRPALDSFGQADVDKILGMIK